MDPLMQKIINSAMRNAVTGYTEIEFHVKAAESNRVDMLRPLSALKNILS